MVLFLDFSVFWLILFTILNREVLGYYYHSQKQRCWIDGSLFVFRPDIIMATTISFYIPERGWNRHPSQHAFTPYILVHISRKFTVHGSIWKCIAPSKRGYGRLFSGLWQFSSISRRTAIGTVVWSFKLAMEPLQRHTSILFFLLCSIARHTRRNPIQQKKKRKHDPQSCMFKEVSSCSSCSSSCLLFR